MSKYNISTRKLIQLLRKNGFVLTRQSGSHAVFKNEAKKKKITVPIHSKNIPTGTLHSILKDASLEL